MRRATFLVLLVPLVLVPPAARAETAEELVEKAIAALSVLEDAATTPDRREQLLNDAADAVWAFFIQREICGLRSNRDAVQRYGIPKEVMARLGIVRKP